MIVAYSKEEIKGRGDVYTINLKDNNLPALRTEINEKLLFKEGEIKFKDKVYKVKVIGIGMFATPEDFEHKDVGLLVTYKEE